MTQHLRDDRDTRPDGGPDVVEVAAASTKRRAAVGFATGVLLTAAVLALMIQNTSTVRLEWLVFDFDAPRWLLVVGGVVIGAVAGPLLLALLRRQHDRRNRRMRVVDAARRGSN